MALLCCAVFWFVCYTPRSAHFFVVTFVVTFVCFVSFRFISFVVFPWHALSNFYVVCCVGLMIFW